MYLSSFLIAKGSSFILPLISPLNKGWNIDEISNTRIMLEPKQVFNINNINKIDILLDKNDHRHFQEKYLNESDRILYRLYIPKNDMKYNNVLVWFHGGGFVIGNIRSEDEICSKISYKTNTIVVNVNYGLSPENKFPVAINDGINSLNWVYKNIEKYKGNKDNIYIAGESAGGNIAVSIVPELSFKLKGVISIYPPLQVFSFSNSHWKYANYNGFFLLNHLLRIYSSYFSNLFEDAKDDRASPVLMNENKIKKFPKTLLILAKYDILFDEGIKFSEILKKNNISTEVKTYPDIHGFFNRFGYGDKSVNDILNFIK